MSGLLGPLTVAELLINGHQDVEHQQLRPADCPIFTRRRHGLLLGKRPQVAVSCSPQPDDAIDGEFRRTKITRWCFKIDFGPMNCKNKNIKKADEHINAIP